MKITFIYPNISRPVHRYQQIIGHDVVSPLAFGILASLTPPDITVVFYDDRIEKIPYDEFTNYVCLSVDTSQVRRAREIAQEYSRRRVPIIMGGLHPTIVPKEVIEYCDSAVVGEAEDVWAYVVADMREKKLKKFYIAKARPSLHGRFPKRDIFKGKKYVKVYPVEFGRGCQHTCNFCMPSVAYHHTCVFRPVSEVIEEIKSFERSVNILFCDANIAADPSGVKQLLRALIPLHIQWIGNATVDITLDEELLDLVAESGCVRLLIGFESCHHGNLGAMNKQHNILADTYDTAVDKIHKRGISILASFVFGYEHEQKETFNEVLQFALRSRFFKAYFNSIAPYPGTKIYQQLDNQKRLLSKKWWLDDQFFLGDDLCKPLGGAPIASLEAECRKIRKKFYSILMILYRMSLYANHKNVKRLINYLLNNVFYFYRRKDGKKAYSHHQ